MDEIAAWNQLSERKRRIFTLLLQNEKEFRGFLMYVGAIDTDDTISDETISDHAISDHAIIDVSEFILSEYKNHICAHADIPIRNRNVRLMSDKKESVPIVVNLLS